MFASDLPQGEWSAVLVGDYWPGAGALEALAAAAEARQQSTTHLHGYADHLRAIGRAHLAGQEGATAEAARLLFSRGAERARATAERNETKHRSYEAARHSVAALRETLAQIAENGNAAIRRIQESPGPAAAKVAGIVEVITEAQTQARAKTAENAGAVLSQVQTVLDAQGADVSARAFAGAQGVDPAPPRPPCLEAVTQQVTARLTESGAGTHGGAAAGQPNPLQTGPDRAAASDRPALDRVAGAATALSTGAGTLAAAAGGAIEASLAGAADGSASPGAAPAESPAATAVPAGDRALATPTAVPAGLPPTADPRPVARPVAVPAPPAAAGSPAIGSPPSPPTPNHSGAATALHPSPAAAAANQSALIRRVASASILAPPERAVAVAEPAPANRTDHLARLLAAVTRQQPELRWAVGERRGGDVVLVTDLAGGWIPPAVEIPAGARVLEPARRQGDLTALLGDCTAAVTYTPGQPLAPDSPTVPCSPAARAVPAVADLGWELVRATTWRDGLPRLAHTLARAVTAGTGWLDSEAALLREQVDAAAARVLAGYPGDPARADVGNWQLLVTIDALLSGRNDLSTYHLAWFLAGQR